MVDVEGWERHGLLLLLDVALFWLSVDTHSLYLSKAFLYRKRFIVLTLAGLVGD